SNVLRCVLNWLYFQLNSGWDAAGSPATRPPGGITPRPAGAGPTARPAAAGSRGRAGPLTTGAVNCIEVSLRIRTTKSRISTQRARRVSDSFALSLPEAGAGNAFHMPCSLAMGPTSAARGCDEAAGSPSIRQTNGKYLAEP